MGACYYVKLKIKVKDEEGAIKALNEHIANDKRTVYHLDKFAEAGITTDNFDDLMRIFLADFKKSDEFIHRQKNGFVIYQDGFDATYSWEMVLADMFKTLTPFIEDGSILWIYPDNDYDKFVVRDGKCVQLH